MGNKTFPIKTQRFKWIGLKQQWPHVNLYAPCHIVDLVKAIFEEVVIGNKQRKHGTGDSHLALWLDVLGFNVLIATGLTESSLKAL